MIMEYGLEAVFMDPWVWLDIVIKTLHGNGSNITSSRHNHPRPVPPKVHVVLSQVAACYTLVGKAMKIKCTVYSHKHALCI